MTAQRIAPTVILQDLVMPGIEGLTLVREVSRPRSDASYANYCASRPARTHTKRDAFAVGANDYIVKLPDKIELIARIPLSLAGLSKPTSTR